MKKRDLHGKNLIEKKHDPENYTQTRMYIPRHVTLTSKCNIKVVKGTSPKPQLKFPSHGQSSNAQYKSKTVLLLLNSKAISRKCFFILTQVSKMCTRCWWKLCQIQFGNLHHHFTYQCTVSQSNSFSTHTVHTLKKLFYTPIWQGEKLLRRAHVQFSHTKEKAPHDCIHAHTTMSFIGTPLSHCPAKHAANYVHTNHQVLQLRQCVTYIWGHTSHVTCIYACMKVQAFQQWRIRERKLSVHCAESRPACKTWGACTLH